MPGRITSLTPAEKKLLDDSLAARERVIGKPLKGTRRTAVLNAVREQILSQRRADAAKNQRTAERQATHYSWSKPTPPRR